MKKLSTLLFFFALTFTIAYAQEFKKFRVGLGVGYARPSGNGSKGGILFYWEPSYRVNDQVAAGLRMEFGVMARGYSESTGGTDFDISTCGSYTLNGQYYFSNNSFRPFVGAGFGMYSLKASRLIVDGSTSLNVKDETKFGFYPRIGFDASHFTMTLDYNIVGATKVEGGNGKFINNYIGLRIGTFFGGGRK